MEEHTQADQNEHKPHTPLSNGKSTNNVVIFSIGFLCALLVIAIVVIIFLLGRAEEEEKTSTIPMPSTELSYPEEGGVDEMVVQVVEEDDEMEEEKMPVLGEADVDGIRWYSSWVQLENVGIYGDYNEEEDYGTTYYTAAVFDDGAELIVMAVPGLGTHYYRFVSQEDGTYLYLDSYSQQPYEDAIEWMELDKIAGIDDRTISALDAPVLLELEGFSLQRYDNPFGLVQLSEYILESEGVTVLTETEYGTLYQQANHSVPEGQELQFSSYSYKLVLADGTYFNYVTYKPFIADDNSLIANWSADFTQTHASYNFYFQATSGCGVGSVDEVVPVEAVHGLVPVGTTAAGEKIYAPNSASNIAIQVAYETYSIGRQHGEFDILTIEEFAAAQPLIIWEAPNDTLVAFLALDYAPLAECGKPVIYLYPEEETTVQVQVGADVTVSEPAYGNGWIVQAQPTGVLTMPGGEEYGSLFWEGTGYGTYPLVQFGRVVESAHIEEELIHDLTAQGLQGQEIQDFMEFWLPLMPNTPYIRLSWFTTEQMNELAPLRVTPMPQSVQRVFLDFEGVDNPEALQLQPQQLQRFERNGFTLVEWGGLLIGDQHAN